MGTGPRLLVTGFGPFPGAPENPTAALVQRLAAMPPGDFGAAALEAIVLPTEYRRSWERLRRLYRTYRPDVVVHFGLSARARSIQVETLAVNVVDPSPDAVGYAPATGRAWGRGGKPLAATFPAAAIASELAANRIDCALSVDAGRYVCNATFYRSLASSSLKAARVGFIHVPPDLGTDVLLGAARIILRTAVRWETSPA